MFETSFSIDAKHKRFLDWFYEGLKKSVKDSKAIVAYNVMDERVFLSVACEDIFAVNMKSEIMDLLSQIFALGFKHDYLKKRLNIYKENLLTKTLINTMTLFDCENDKKLAKKELFNQQVGAIDGFFNFRFKKLKKKWNEVIDLTNENSIVLYNNDVAEEFLAFLFDALPSGENEIKICKKDEKIQLFDKGGLKIPVTIPFWCDCEDEEAVLYNIVLLQPQKVVLCDEKSFSHDFVYIIKRFF
ncbi:MAG: hypothetical protein IJV77_07045 [Clostridia bacterium]|nr:hypothetical protein [Clostridia bacterium]